MKDVTKPNIIFLLIDSFRSDKFYGKEKTSKTPNLDSLIQNGAYFSQAISSAPVTIPSISSIMTSSYPFKAIMSGGSRFKLNTNVKTFVSHLKETGYFTIAITPEILSLSGLTRDFSKVLTFPSHSGLYDGVGQQILNTFEKNISQDPWFLYIHLLDIHGTARGFPKNFDDKKFGVNQYEKMISAMDVWIGKIIQKVNLDDTLIVLTADHGNDAGIYTSELEKLKVDVNKDDLESFLRIGKNISSKLPKSLSPLKSKIRKIYLGKKDQIKTKKKSDNIEEINKKQLTPYKKRILEHAIKMEYDVFDDRFRVPLLFAGYGIKTNTIIQQQIRTMDIFPTILDIINIQKNTPVDGKSVLPLINGDHLKELPAYMESTANWTKSKTTDVIGIRYLGYKYFRNRINPNEMVGLYDLKIDPLEENNLAEQYPDKVTEMEKLLAKIRLNASKNIEKEADSLRNFDEEKRVEEELKKLGYV